MVHHKGAVYDGQHEGIVDPVIWQKVQNRLRMAQEARIETKDDSSGGTQIAASSKKIRTCSTESSLLIGKVFDETGDRLTPSHASKKGRRYRYYVSNRLIARSGEHKPEAGGWRLSALTLEKAVADTIHNWLRRETLPIQMIEDASADEQVMVQRKITAFVEGASKNDKPLTLYYCADPSYRPKARRVDDSNGCWRSCQGLRSEP